MLTEEGEHPLQARYAYKDIGGYHLFLRSYEGMIPGPTLRVRPGDVLRIRLINDLPPNGCSPSSVSTVQG